MSGDPRYLGFLASTELANGAIHRDQKLLRTGYFRMNDAVSAFPQFNLFSRGFVLSGQQVDSGDKARAYAESLIKNAPDPVFVTDLQGKITLANDAVSQLLGFRTDEVVEQSVSRFISPEETRQFTDALREVVEKGVSRNASLNPRAASGELIPTTLNASALRDTDGNVIGALGILRDMRAYHKVVRDLEQSKSELQEKILDLEKFEEVVVGRELKMIALEKEIDALRREGEQRDGK